MAVFIVYEIFLFLFLSKTNSLKIWIPNTDISNSLNWDKKDTPKDCDNIFFRALSEITTYWNIQKVALTGLTLPETGNLVFKNNVKIQFRDKEKCSVIRDLEFIRREVKGWLDPYNWKSDSEDQWLPHVERVPCAGEPILFPSQKTFAVQLPSIMVPMGTITFDTEEFRGDTWSEFLKTDLGFQLFKGTDDLRSLPWRNDVECSHNKCICGRNSYTIRDGRYRDTDSHIYEEAICLYAMSKCQISACYSAVVPEGHCCGICGALIKIKDKTKEGLNISIIKTDVEKELEYFNYKNKLKTYVGRTKDQNIQVVIIAQTPDDTIQSHRFANLLKRKLIDQKLEAKITSKFSGLKFSNYLFNSVTGVTFGTLLAVLMFMFFIFYIYVILPKKNLGSGNPFMFARFDNKLSEENLEIGVEPGSSESLPRAFDNPIYLGNTEPRKEKGESGESSKFQMDEPSDSTTTKEFRNLVYSELEKTKELDKFEDSLVNDEEKFTEIEF